MVYKPLAMSTMFTMCKMSDKALSRYVPRIKYIKTRYYSHFEQIARYGKIKYILYTLEHIQLFVVNAT